MKRKYSQNKWAHRRLTVPPHFLQPQEGEDIKALQVACNKQAERAGISKLIVDSQCGRQTVAVARAVAKSLGVGVRGAGVPVYVQHVIRHPRQRTPMQVRRGHRWKKLHNDTGNPHVKDNTVTGGSPAERVVAALFQAAHLYYTGASHRFYSQFGVTTFDHAITGEAHGERSDCSQFFTGICHSAGVKDPCEGDYNPAASHFTGTVWKSGRFVKRSELKPGGSILYGLYPTFHHIEGYVGDGNSNHTWADMPANVRDRTIGHGSPPVDFGDIDMIAGAHFVNYDHADVA